MARAVELWTRGLGRLRGFWPVLVLAWALQTALALPATFPVHRELEAALSSSGSREIAAGRLDMDWFMDFEARGRRSMEETDPMLALAAALGLLLWVFLAGGVYARLHAAGEPPGPAARVRLADFLADAARLAPRFLRLFFATAIGYAVVLWVIRIRFSAWLEDQMQWWPSELAVLAARLALTALVLWLLAWLHMAQDIARLRVVVHGRRGMARELLSGLGRAWRSFDRLSAIYLWGLGGWIVVTGACLLLVEAAGGIPAPWTWIAILVVTQLAVLGRAWIGLGLAATMLSWFEAPSGAGESAEPRPAA